MTFLGFLVLLVIAAIASTLGQAIAGYSLGGCLMSFLVGFVGAYLSIIGSALLSTMLGLILHHRPVV